MESAKRILVVDDEIDICEILKYNLQSEGYEVETANSAEEALQLDIESFNLLLLDIMMGEMSGVTMAIKIKSTPSTRNIPIIFLSAKDTENDKITGLTIGADDYISKPFSIREVILRVAAVLRRSAANVENVVKDGDLCYHTLRIDLAKKVAYVANEDVQLTKKEFEILKLLLENRGKVLSREEIMQKVWSDDVVVLDRAVDVNIARLRKKIEPYAKCITTRQGFGYCFEDA